VTLEQLGLDKVKGWDIRVLEAVWRSWVYSKNIKVRNADSNFIIQWAI